MKKVKTNSLYPIFQSVFGNNWELLPPLFRRHYHIRPNSTDQIKIEGYVDIRCSKGYRVFMPIFKWFKTLMPYEGKNIPITVFLRSNKNEFHFQRTFYPENESPYLFTSYMVQRKDNIVIEFMPNRIGWKTLYLYEDNKVKLKHLGYVIKLFGLTIPLPLTFLFGKIYLEKEAVSYRSFTLKMNMTHFLLGKYEYHGNLNIVETHS